MSLREITGTGLASDLGSMLSNIDRVALTPTFAEELARGFRGAVENGVAGWRDDDLAVAKDWGFAISDITVPVAVWQGGQDRWVAFTNGEWLAAEIPTAEAHLLEDEGHLSLIARMDEILANLLALGG